MSEGAKIVENITLGNKEDLHSIEVLYEACKLDLLKKEIFQWDDSYPTPKYFEWVVQEKEMYVLREAGEIVGAVVLNEWQVPEWESVNWSQNQVDDRFLVIHAFCTHPKVQGKGYGGELLQFAEDLARKERYAGIRLDAFSENLGALKFYEKRGYVKKGEVFFSSKPLNHEIYYCYERFL